MGGNHSVDQFGVYGTLGVPSLTNIPGSRTGASSWIDHQGHLWLFGGVGNSSVGAQSGLNDLWEFVPATNEWAWRGGISAFNCDLPQCGEAGVYGTLGVQARTNTPGGRNGAMAWTDNDGNLWLFGGSGFDSTPSGFGNLNDLWEFDGDNSEWTWMGGSSIVGNNGHGQPGVYGSLGVPASSNVPGGRYDGATWTDSEGNLWLFGGQGVDSAGNFGYLNDLWKFDPTTNEWTWLSGNRTQICELISGTSVCSQPGVYGTQGSPAQGNVPGGRYRAVTWADHNGNLWLFGGWGYDGSEFPNQGWLNDLWEFDPVIKQWAWIGGSKDPFSGGHIQLGIYGTLGRPDAGNLPGGRQSAVSWVDRSGNFWLFGGEGFGSTLAPGYDHGTLDDLWQFNPSIKEWAWMGGSDHVECPGTSWLPFGDLWYVTAARCIELSRSAMGSDSLDRRERRSVAFFRSRS